MKKYICRHTYHDGTTAEWTGTVSLMYETANLKEVMIKGRGSAFTVIIGNYSYGHLICIPEINVGCPLSQWDDFFWNEERLSVLMNETDAVTVAAGVKTLMAGRDDTRNR